jgi:hypothetical protein
VKICKQRGTFLSHIIIFISWWFKSCEMWHSVTGQAANYLSSNTTSHPRRLESSAALLWGSQILHCSFHCVMYWFVISQIKPLFWTTEPCPFCNRSSFNYEEVLSKNVQACVLSDLNLVYCKVRVDVYHMAANGTKYSGFHNGAAENSVFLVYNTVPKGSLIQNSQGNLLQSSS